jgi:hypothetical protein
MPLENTSCQTVSCGVDRNGSEQKEFGGPIAPAHKRPP